jgi:hypothetical protein
VNIQRRFIETEDDWSGITPSSEYEFIDVLGVKQQFKVSKDPNLLLQVRFALEVEKMNITRTAY